MKTLFTVFYFVFISSLCALSQTGFFLVVGNNDHCSRLVKSFDYLQQYCITEEPIIKEMEFKAEGSLQYGLTQQEQFFNIRFTKNGFETLKLICKHLPDKKLVLVVNGKGIGTYDNRNLKPTVLMQISGKANSKEINWVFENLKKNK
jgi:hypothetical protein